MKFLVFFLLINIQLTNFSLAENKIVFLNVNYIFSNSIAGKNANDIIKDKIINLENEVNKFSLKVNKERDEVIKQKNILSENDFKSKLDNIEKKVTDFNQKSKIKKDEITELKKRVRSNFLDQLREILSEYSSQNSIELIIKQENVLIGSNKLNISKDILEILNKKKIELIN